MEDWNTCWPLQILVNPLLQKAGCELYYMFWVIIMHDRYTTMSKMLFHVWQQWVLQDINILCHIHNLLVTMYYANSSCLHTSSDHNIYSSVLQCSSQMFSFLCIDAALLWLLQIYNTIGYYHVVFCLIKLDIPINMLLSTFCYSYAQNYSYPFQKIKFIQLSSLT